MDASSGVVLVWPQGFPVLKRGMRGFGGFVLCLGSLARVPEQVGMLWDNAGGAWCVPGSALEVSTRCPSRASGLSKPRRQQWEEEIW